MSQTFISKTVKFKNKSNTLTLTYFIVVTPDLDNGPNMKIISITGATQDCVADCKLTHKGTPESAISFAITQLEENNPGWDLMGEDDH